ncbi:MAG: hypothetical protein ACRC5W_03075, partial [Cetobacterium sp.]
MIVINTGATANDGTGNTLRDAFIIVNENFESIDTLLSGNDVLTISQITGLQTALNNINNQLSYIPGLQTDINSINNTIFTINQTLISQNTSIADLYDAISDLQTQIFTKIEEAPIDGESYVRKDAGWVLAPTQSGVYATPSFQEVLQVNNVSTIGFQLNNGAIVSNLSPNILEFSNLTGYTTLDANSIQFQSQEVIPSKIVSMSPDGIRFRLGANDVQLLYNPAQTVGANFQFPLRNTFGTYTLATTLDYTLNNVLTAGSTTTQTANFLTIGSTRTNINHTGLEVLDVLGNQMTTKIESDVIRFTRFGNVVTLSALGAAGGSFALNYVLPVKLPGTYSLAVTTDLYSVTSLQNNTLNISTLGSGTNVSRVFNVRGLTSSNNTISITGTGSNTLTNWAWDLKSNITKTSDLINDGDNGTSHFISLEDLPSTLTLYPTTATSSIGGYNRLVTSITDPIYNVTAVDVSTGEITGTDQLIAGLITEPGLIIGNPGIFNMTTIGNIRKTSGSGQAEF